MLWLGKEASGRGPGDAQDVSRVASGASGASLRRDWLALGPPFLLTRSPVAAFPGACCFNHELELHSGRGFTCTPVEAQLSVHRRGSLLGQPLGTATLSVAPAGDGTPVVRHLTLEECSLRRGTQLRVAVRLQPRGSPDEPWFMPDVPSAGAGMPRRTASAGSDSVASAESSDCAEGDQTAGGKQALPPVTSAPLHHDRRRGLARLFGKRRSKKAGAAAPAASPDASGQQGGGPSTTVAVTSTWFFGGWLARGSGVAQPVDGPSGCLSVGAWTADAQGNEAEGTTPAAADGGDAPSPPGSGRFARGNLLRGFGGGRSGRVVHHSRSASAPAEAMAAPRSMLLGNDEDAFQQQLTQALAASSLATLPAHMRMKRRRPGRSSAHASSAAALTPSAAQSGVATPSGAPLHEHKKVHSSNALLQHGGDDGDASDALQGDAPPSPSCPSSQPWLLTPLREGSLPCAGEWLHLELALPDSDPAAAPLAADVFFASIDQRSAEAGGAGACACTAVALAAWLETHPADLPVGRGGGELDDLIRDGSATWRELRSNSATAAQFPDGHFDLETALSQAPSRLHAVPGASFVAFMAPPIEALAKLEAGASEALQGLLKGAQSLEAALRSAHGEARPGRPATAVVSLMDHHSCVRLCASGECVLVDTLGERLYEANTKAFLMRFSSLDDLVTFMQRLVAAPRLQALGPADLANGAHKLQVDVQVVRNTDDA